MKPSFNIKRNPSNLIIFSGLCLVTILLVGSGGFYRRTETHIQDLENIRNGAHICASRAAQSYFAMANAQFSASVLQSEFLSKTDDCFYKVNQRAQEIGTVKLTETSTKLYDRYISFKNAVRNSAQMTVGISDAYNDIDTIKFDFSVAVAKNIRSLITKRDVLKYFFIFCVFALGVLSFIFLVLWNKWDSKLKDMEDQAAILMDDYIDNGARIERLIERVFDYIKLPQVKGLFLEYHTRVLEQGIDQDLRTIELKLNDDLYTKDYAEQVFSNVTEADLKSENWNLDSDFSEVEKVVETSVRAADIEIDDEDEFDMFKPIDISDIDMDPSLQAITEMAKKLDEDAQEFKMVEEVDKSTIANLAAENVVEIAPQINIPAPVVAKGISFQKLLGQTTRAFLKNSDYRGLAWEFDTNYQDFEIMQEIEQWQQIIHCLIVRSTKAFDELGIDQNLRTARVQKSVGRKFVELTINIKGILFNTAELEYFNTQDPALRKLVDVNLVMLQKMVLGLRGDLAAQNNFDLESNKYMALTLYIPFRMTNLRSELDDDHEAANTPVLKRLVKSTKSELMKRLGKENIV